MTDDVTCVAHWFVVESFARTEFSEEGKQDKQIELKKERITWRVQLRKNIMKEDSHQMSAVHVSQSSVKSEFTPSDKQKLHAIQPGEGLGIDNCAFMTDFHAIMELRLE